MQLRCNPPTFRSDPVPLGEKEPDRGRARRDAAEGLGHAQVSMRCSCWRKTTEHYEVRTYFVQHKQL